MTNLQIEMTIAALILLIIIIICLKKNTMSVKSSIAWLLLPIVFAFIAIFPEPITALATWLGFETLANFIFVIVIALLIILCFFLTITISRQQTTITKLIQDVSILKYKINHKNEKQK